MPWDGPLLAFRPANIWSKRNAVGLRKAVESGTLRVGHPVCGDGAADTLASRQASHRHRRQSQLSVASRPRNQRCLRSWIAEKPGLPTEAGLLRVSGEAQHCRQVAAQHDREPFAIRLQRDLVDQAAGDTGGFGLGFLALQALELEPFDVRAHLVLPGRAPETPFSESARSRIHIPEPYAPLAQSVFAAWQQSTMVTRALDVAEAVWRVANDPSCPMRLTAGADAVALASPA